MPEAWEGTFDAVVSIEMIEAVGPRNMAAYFAVAQRALKPGGSFLVQAILGSGEPDEWISVYIFPGGVLPSVSQIGAAISNRFDIVSWDSFGKDYDATLMEWHSRFTAAWPKIQRTEKDGARAYPDRFARMWRYYLLLCAGAFRSRYIDVAQIVFRARS
jgi:cyclopropane-fatty-acyl-phospholipid synthase